MERKIHFFNAYSIDTSYYANLKVNFIMDLYLNYDVIGFK